MTSFMTSSDQNQLCVCF